MILQLMKYEMKSTYRIFLAIVISFILLTALLCIGMINQNPILLTLFSLSSVVIGIAAFIAYFVTILNRYYKNLYGREGYLMRTLPVKGWQLVLSKFIMAMFWSCILGITVVLCVMITLQIGVWMAPPNYSYTLWALLKEFIYVVGGNILVYFLIAVFCAVAESIARIYFVISIAYLPVIRKWNVLVAIVLFFVIDIAETFLVQRILDGMTMDGYTDIITIIKQGGVHFGYVFVAVSIVLTMLLLFCSSYILEKKTSVK